MKATATRIGGDLYDVIYPGHADCDRNVPMSYIERLVHEGYTVTVNQRTERYEGEPETYTLRPTPSQF